MQTTTFSKLIKAGILVVENPEALDDPDEPFVSYVVCTGYVLLTKAQADHREARINYVQYVREDGPCWVVQLERLPEDPNNYPKVGSTLTEIDVELYVQTAIG